MSSISSTIAPLPSFITSKDDSPLKTGEQIASWSVGNKKVTVLQVSDNLSYSIAEGSKVETGKVSLTLYDTPALKKFAPKLIAFFQHVLLCDGVKPSFLPTFFTMYERPNPAPSLLLGLFAQLKRTEWGKEVVQAKWGFREFAKDVDTVNWLEVTDQETKDFLTGTPIYGNEFEDYCCHFKEVVTLDADHKVRAIAMRCVSALNKEISLNENTWAVTLISAQKRAGWGKFFPLGHGSVAWEGVEAGSYFLKWADITTAYENRQPGEARIRIENRTIPSTNWMLGPTCSRPKNSIKAMVEYISRDITVSDGSTWSSNVKFKFLAPFRNMLKSAMEIEEERRKLAALENCLSFAVSALKRAEIFLPEPGRAEPNIEPNLYVISVRTNYVAENQDNRIVFRHKKARHSANDDVEDQILAHLKNNILDAVNAISISDLPTQDDDLPPHAVRPTNASNDDDDE